MRKIIVLNWVSLDGFIACNQGETDWFPWDSEIEDYYEERQGRADTAIFGKETYEVMSQYWPDPTRTISDRPGIIDFMNNATKIVFSTSLVKADWNNSRIVNAIDRSEVEGWKHSPGKDLLIYGSGTIVSQFSELRLIDEYALMLYPIVLGSGKPLFPNISERMKLNLISSRLFSCGSMLHTYSPEN